MTFTEMPNSGMAAGGSSGLVSSIDILSANVTLTTDALSRATPMVRPGIHFTPILVFGR
jgi:hypothetical protein